MKDPEAGRKVEMIKMLPFKPKTKRSLSCLAQVP
jgi:hypothetical protein